MWSSGSHAAVLDNPCAMSSGSQREESEPWQALWLSNLTSNNNVTSSGPRLKFFPAVPQPHFVQPAEEIVHESIDCIPHPVDGCPCRSSYLSQVQENIISFYGEGVVKVCNLILVRVCKEAYLISMVNRRVWNRLSRESRLSRWADKKYSSPFFKLELF